MRLPWDYYGKEIFFRENFGKLKDILKDIKGKFMFSINDVPEIRQLYKDFIIHEEQTTYTTP
ncbi:MAG: hypothetical protein H7844_11810 [Nitrospirae bacterium YQR-1]